MKKSKPAVVLENELEYWREKIYMSTKKKSMTQAIKEEEFRVWERKKERETKVMRNREEKSRYSKKITKKSFCEYLIKNVFHKVHLYNSKWYTRNFYIYTQSLSTVTDDFASTH